MKKKVSIFGFVLAILFQGRLWAVQWDPVATGYSYHFHAIKFCDADKGVIVGQQAILRTTDGGENWNRVQLFKKDLYSLAVPSAERPEKVVVGNNGTLLRSRLLTLRINR